MRIVQADGWSVTWLRRGCKRGHVGVTHSILYFSRGVIYQWKAQVKVSCQLVITLVDWIVLLLWALITIPRGDRVVEVWVWEILCSLLVALYHRYGYNSGVSISMRFTEFSLITSHLWMYFPPFFCFLQKATDLTGFPYTFNPYTYLHTLLALL